MGLFDLSDAGLLVYTPVEATRPERTLVWVDRQGREEAIPGVPRREYVYPRLSPDGTKVALDTRDQDEDIHIWDLDRSVLTNVTLDRELDRSPVWTPKGDRIAFSSSRVVPAGVFWQPADGTGTPERLFENQTIQVPMAFVENGRRLIVREEALSKTASDLMIITLEGERRLDPLIRSEAVETNAEVSSNGRWLAYQAADSIWVTSFPDVSKGRWKISIGSQPLWSRDGRELFFLGLDGRLMRVAIQTEPAFVASSPTRVLERAYIWNAVGLSGRTYDISPDGRRFLMIKGTESANSASGGPQMVAVLNWFEELRRRVPATRSQ
jgi:Tol biopolymer transport system component